jgi:hypothetical protein
MNEEYYRKSLTRYNPPVFNAELQGEIKYIEVGLEHVRAADSIRISYDFDRDGYRIEQSRLTEDDQMMDDWQEVAFIPAWGLDERKD